MDPGLGDGAHVTYWISFPNVTFSMEAKDGVVVAASVVAEWAIGHHVVIALDFYRQQGANIDWIIHD